MAIGWYAAELHRCVLPGGLFLLPNGVRAPVYGSKRSGAVVGLGPDKEAASASLHVGQGLRRSGVARGFEFELYPRNCAGSPLLARPTPDPKIAHLNAPGLRHLDAALRTQVSRRNRTL